MREEGMGEAVTRQFLEKKFKMVGCLDTIAPVLGTFRD